MSHPRCAESPSPELIKGIREFNRREYFQCHETLEAIWLVEPDPFRQFYQGILQVGVGFLHLSRNNYLGAVELLERGVRRLQPFSPRCMGVEIESLIKDANRCREALMALGEKRIGEFDRGMLPQIALSNNIESGLSEPR